MSFEESMKKLEEMTEKIRNEETSLDEALKYYEEGIQAYQTCSDILDSARQKIEIIER